MKSSELKAEFWELVEIPSDEPNACWPWLGGKTAGGYGALRVDGEWRYAHRVAHELNIGAIPSGHQVDHVCHNKDRSCEGGSACVHRSCVNPAHIEATTQKENMRRGRARRSDPLSDLKRRNRDAVAARLDELRAEEPALSEFLTFVTSGREK